MKGYLPLYRHFSKIKILSIDIWLIVIYIVTLQYYRAIEKIFL